MLEKNLRDVDTYPVSELKANGIVSPSSVRMGSEKLVELFVRCGRTPIQGGGGESCDAPLPLMMSNASRF